MPQFHSPRFHRLVDKSEDKFAIWAGTWDVEIVAIAFSFSTLAALIALLIAGNDKAIWSGVTLNTYVSILATASKLSALFALSSAIGQTKWNTFRRQSGSLLEFEAIDLASRGALGSLQLLFQTRKVALIGALTFILAFAFDPFTQQLIQTKTDTKFTDSPNVAAPVTARYSGGSQLHHSMAVVNPSTGETLLDPSVDYAMQSAILSGLVQDEATLTQQLVVACPSGNCTWDPMPSLAVCNRCNKLESMLTKSVSLGDPLPYALSADSATMTANCTRFSLPNGLYIENLDGYSPLHMTALGTGDPKATVTMKQVDTLIWSMTILKAAPNPTNASASWPDLPIQATECGLYYCVNQYGLEMEGNQIKQNSTELVNFKRQTDSWRPYRLSPNGAVSWVTMNATAQDSLAWDFKSSVNRTDLSLSNSTQLFNVSFDAVRSISSFFTTNFFAKLSTDGNVTGYYMDGPSGPDFRPSVMQLLQDSPNIDERFDTLALSMSNAIRMHKPESEDIHGQLGNPVTKYTIEWPWIIMPILIVLATLIQLIITMRNSRTRPILKSSILAVLSRGQFVRGVFDGAETVKDMRDAAAHEKVNLFDMTEPMISPRHAKKFSIGSSSYLTAWSPEMGYDRLRSSPFTGNRSEQWDDSSTVFTDGNGSARMRSSGFHGLGIVDDDGSPLVSPRRAQLSSFHGRSASGGSEVQESLLQDLQESCHHFRPEDRGPR